MAPSARVRPNWCRARRRHHGAHELPARHPAATTIPPSAPAPTFQPTATHAAISRYALGRDYHKLLRARLQKLADRIADEIGDFGYRVFTDSAPVMEVELAKNAGLGWRGKHTLLLSREAGSWFFLGEIFVDLPLPPDAPHDRPLRHLPRLPRRLPDAAFAAPYQLDARRCISYLTIELKGAIPLELRPLIGNRIYGCDDCQTCLPVESRCAADARGGFRAAPRARRRDAGSNCLPGTKRSSRTACRQRRSAASATSAGCATSPWHWAMHRPRREVIAALKSRRSTSFGAGARARGLGARAPCRELARPSPWPPAAPGRRTIRSTSRHRAASRTAPPFPSPAGCGRR